MSETTQPPAYAVIPALLFLLAAMPVQAQQVDLLMGRIAHYSLEGEARDISGYGNHGLIEGALPAANRENRPGKALRFDGENDLVFCGNGLAEAGTSLTVAVWMRTPEHQQYAHVVSKYDPESDAGFILGIQDGCVKWAGRNGTGRYLTMTSGMRIDDGQWHHVTAVVDGDSWSIWVDGQLESQIFSGRAGRGLDCDEPLTIGMYYRGDAGDHRFYKGVADDVILYSRPLNACEIEALCSGPHPPR